MFTVHKLLFTSPYESIYICPQYGAIPWFLIILVFNRYISVYVMFV